LVTVKGIAHGRENLVMLDTGEMLADGELSRCGIRVARIDLGRAWLAWRGVTNVLRKGESTAKPVPE